MEQTDTDGGTTTPFTQLVWSVAAALCLVVAGALLWLGRSDWAFVAASLGVVAWFLNMRGQLHRRNVERDAARAGDSDEDVDDET
jgi:hypothetical protein